MVLRGGPGKWDTRYLSYSDQLQVTGAKSTKIDRLDERMIRVPWEISLEDNIE